MLTCRLQILLDEPRYTRLAAEAQRRRVSVAVVVRDAIDAALAVDADARADAARAILAAAPMPVPGPRGLKDEIDAIRARRA